MKRLILCLLILSCESKPPPPVVEETQSLSQICQEYADARVETYKLEQELIQKEAEKLAVKANIQKAKAELERNRRLKLTQDKLDEGDLAGALAALPDEDLMEVLRQMREDRRDR